VKLRTGQCALEFAALDILVQQNTSLVKWQFALVTSCILHDFAPLLAAPSVSFGVCQFPPVQRQHVLIIQTDKQ
jgi:hypothetical protein